MKKLFTILVALAAIYTGSHRASAWIHGTPIALPLLVAGTFAPSAQTPSMPSASTWPPSCIDATWGTGCNVPTQTCTAPTVGTPLESCQPPQQLFISSSNASASTGNGTTATIHYTSLNNYAYTATQPLIISGAAQTNWNTQVAGITSFTGGAGSCAPSCTVVLGIQPQTGGTYSSAPFSVGQHIYVGQATANGAQIVGTGWTSGSPNGVWTVSAVTTSSVTFSTGSTQVTGTLGSLNVSYGYNGTVAAPWFVSSSSCAGTACTVAFANPNTCASSCVSTTTSIIAGQNDDAILVWHYGEVMQNSVQNGDVRSCVIPKQISPAKIVGEALDGGAWTTTTTPQAIDPVGVGKSTLSLPATPYSYCFHFAASSVADGLHEIRAYVCPTVGNCMILSSVIAADGNTGSTYFTARAHGYGNAKLLGVTKSFDTTFQNYNWQKLTPSGVTITGGSSNGTNATLTFTQPTTLPVFAAGDIVNIGAVVTANACSVTAGTASGTNLVLTYTPGGACLNSFPVGSNVDITTIVASGGNGYTWNGTQVPVTANNTSTNTITVSSLSTETYASGGTITESWNGPCVISAASSGSISCPDLGATTTRASGGTSGINAQGNLYCTVGGAGDWPAPFASTLTTAQRSQMNPDSFQLIAMSVPAFGVTGSTNCTGVQNQTGCQITNCGLTPSQPETLWLTRKDSGLDERGDSGGHVRMNQDGSLWITTNAGGTIQSQNAYANQWKQTSGGIACRGSVVAAGAPLTAYTGNYCNDMKSAFVGLVPTENGLAQTLANASSCLTFTRSGNGTGLVPFFVGEPLVFTGYDTNVSPSLSQYGVYWVKSLVSDTLTLSATPTGACINDTAANIVSPLLFIDTGMDNVLLACDTSVTTPCSTSNPETYPVGSALNPTGVTTFAKSGWLGMGPDTASGSTFPAAHNTVSVLSGGAGPITFPLDISRGGRIHVTADTIQSSLSLSSAVSVGPTPAITTVTSGSLSGTIVTLGFSALSGVAWQIPTAGGSPGQGIIVSGVSPADWNCGTASAPCHILTASSTQITYTNPSATTPTWTSGGKIVPASIILEFASGTFAYNASNTPPMGCASSGISVNTSTALVCLAAYPNGATQTTRAISGTNSTAWPYYFTPTSNSTFIPLTSNCLPVLSGQVAPATGVLTALNITPSALSGGTNDIMELTWPLVAAQTTSFQVVNGCGTGPFTFVNEPLFFPGYQNHIATDTWDDRDVTGPFWGSANGFSGELSNGITGAYYITNSLRYDTYTAANQATYAWGVNAAYNQGTCVNDSIEIVNVRCVGSPPAVPVTGTQPAVPVAFGGQNIPGTRNGAFWIPITTSFSTGATNFTVATGSLPTGFEPGWGAYVVCNFAEPLTTSSSSLVSFSSTNVVSYNNASSPATVTLSTATSAGCTTGQNPVLIPYNFNHIDMAFFLLNASSAPFNLVTALAEPWNYYNNIVYENMQCQGCVVMQGIFLAGGVMMNQDFDDDDVEVASYPIPGQMFAINAWTPVGTNQMYNYIVRNTNLWGRILVEADPQSSPATYTDVYAINVSGGLSWINYLTQGQLNRLYGGFAGGSNSLNIPFGGFEATAIWPTLTQGVDGSGIPNVAGTPIWQSFLASPWYPVSSDTGLGTF